MATAATLLSFEEFLALPEVPGVKRERWEGELVEMGNGRFAHEFVKANIAEILTTAARPAGFRVYSETMYRMAGESDLIPDVSLLARSARVDASGYPDFPVLAVEVVSSETAAQLERKVGLYLNGGSVAVLVVYPATRSIRLYRQDGSAQRFDAGHALMLPELFPTWSCPVEAIFEGL
jgi:Uma2 family endonuclease